jgi:hypothetical protein
MAYIQDYFLRLLQALQGGNINEYSPHAAPATSVKRT